MAGSILIPEYQSTTPGSTVAPGFPGVIRGALSGQSVITLPPPASGGLRTIQAGIAAIPSRLAGAAAPVALPGGQGRATAALARAREATARRVSNLASRLSGNLGRPGNPG
jgi:hypothetical protein